MRFLWFTLLNILLWPLDKLAQWYLRREAR